MAPSRVEVNLPEPTPVIEAVNRFNFNLGYDPCSCISFYKFVSGVPQNEPLGNAWDIKPNSKEPKTGSMILTWEGSGHGGRVINYTDKTVTFEESNFEKCKKTVRTFNRSDVRIRGYRIF